MLLEKIQSDLKEALKAKDEVEISTLRFLLSSIHNREIELRVEKKTLTDEEVIKVIQRQVKERKESIEAFKEGKREDLVKKEQKELRILSNYLPQQSASWRTEKEMKKMVEDVIKEIGATGPSDFGKVMGAVMSKVKGQTNGITVAKLVKEQLAGQA